MYVFFDTRYKISDIRFFWMKYTEEQLKFILEKKPELIKKNEFSSNTTLVKFLNKYKEFEKAAITNIFKIN